MVEIDDIRKAGQMQFEKQYLAKSILESQVKFYMDICPVKLLSDVEQTGKSMSFKPLIDEPLMRELMSKWSDSMKKVLFGYDLESQELQSIDLVKIMQCSNEPKATSINK
jgi:hypothetical protein